LAKICGAGECGSSRCSPIRRRLRALSPRSSSSFKSHYLPLETVIAAPIVVDAMSLGLDIPVTVEGRDLHIAMSELSNIPKAPLRRVVADLAAHEDDIRRALDRLFTGF
jgi:hypothetical protein